LSAISVISRRKLERRKISDDGPDLTAVMHSERMATVDFGVSVDGQHRSLTVAVLIKGE
jgi:hypothetical protein